MRVPLLVVGALSFAVTACASGDDSTAPDVTDAAEATPTTPTTTVTEIDPVDTTPPTIVVDLETPVGFVFGEDDLCEWISPERAAEMVAAHYAWIGTATLNEDSRAPKRCHWQIAREPGGDVATLSVEEASWTGVLDRRTDEPTLSYRGPVDWEDLPEEGALHGVMILGHPQLTDGVGIIYGGFGWHAVGVPEYGQFVRVDVLTDDFTGPNEDAWYSLVNDVIAELGWTP